MDVTCERCSTEYEFDETLVSERGTTVKCTNCGHLFKVYRNEGEGERPWILRRGDGSEQTLASLRELQQAITQGDVAESDRISRSGEAWKRLGDIAELRTFFQAAKAARSTPAVSADSRKQTLFGVGTAPKPTPAPVPPPTVSEPASSEPKLSEAPVPAAPKAPPPPTPPKTTPVESQAPKVRPPPPKAPSTPPKAVNAAPRIDGLEETRATAPQRAPKLSDAPSAPVRERAPKLEEPTKPSPAGRAAPTASLYLDDEEEAAAPPSGGRPFLWVAVILLVAGGVTTALLWDQVAPILGMSAENPASAFLEQGDAAFALGTVDGYDEAVRAYTRASAVTPEDPAVYAFIARAEVYWAQTLAFQASDIDARLAAARAALEEAANEEAADDEDTDPDATPPPADPALVGEAARIRAELQRHAQRGQENAETALGLNDGHGPAEVALASASRLLSDHDAAQTHIDRAQERLPERTADFHLARALLAAATGTMRDAEDGADASVQADGSLVLARLTLARAHLANGNLEGAREQTRAILAAHPSHPGAVALESAMDRGVPPAAPLVAATGNLQGEVPEGEVPEGAALPTPEVTPSSVGSGEPSTARPSQSTGRTAPREAAPEDGPPPAGRDYSWYIGQGDSLMDRGNIGRAREYYQAAVEERPGASEALTGLGYVELERRRYDSAVRYFQQAKRNQYGDAFIGLGEALRRMGRRDEAAAVYQEYLTSRPSGPQASVARRQLEALQQSEPEATDEAPTAVAPSEDAPVEEPDGNAEEPTETPPEENLESPEAPEPVEPDEGAI